jgi:hypothetical protein
MKTRVILSLCVCLLSGCYAKARLYPVQGPLASQAPPPIFAAKASAGLHSGSFSATLANGNACKGRWTRVSTAPTAGNNAPDPSAEANLASAWDTVYGQGYYRANVLGAAMHIQGIIPCQQGTVVHVEAYQKTIGTGSDTTLSIYGVATDNQGNIYKLAF